MRWEIDPKAVLFDLDGTLLDTLEDIASSVNEVLTGRGFPVHSRDAYRLFIGDGSRKLLYRALPPEARIPQTVDECAGEFLETYEANWAAATRPFDGIEEMLDFLDEKGIRLAVLSNKAHAFTVKSVEHFFRSHPFEAVLGQQDGLPLKPDPEGAFRVARMMKLDPGDFLYVGDSSIDMKTARAAGMPSVGVLWGLRGEGELREAGADVLVSHPAEIIKLLP
jgi:phosphoglycolate phosphatase